MVSTSGTSSASSGKHGKNNNASSSGVLVRRRDKRRHITSNSIDLRDPFSVIALAIRFDETRQDEDILQVPLEMGRIYNAKEFTECLHYLERMTAPPQQLATTTATSSASSNSNNINQATTATTSTTNTNSTSNSAKRRKNSSNNATTSSSDKSKSKEKQYRTKQTQNDGGQQQLQTSGESTPNFALTPVILSGLLSLIQEESLAEDPQHGESKNNNSSGKPLPTSSELVQYCQSMRKAALQRVKARNQRQRIQQVVTPVLLIAGLIFLYWWTMSNLQQLLVDLRYVDSCQDDPNYKEACRLSEALLWERLYPQAHPFPIICNIDDCPSIEGQEQLPFYAMHTLLRNEIVPISQVGRGRRSSPRSRTLSAVQYDTPLQWLGETTTNRLIRKTIQSYAETLAIGFHFKRNKTVQVLDVGCGIAGTLYSLLRSPHQPRHEESFFDLYYQGISISQAEIQQARRMARLHGLDPSRVRLDVYSFDHPVPPESHNIMVAIDSLSYSKDLRTTLKSLFSAIQVNGIAIIVTDVVSPWTNVNTDEFRLLKNVTAQPSLIRHDEWLEIFESLNWQVGLTVDLGLEYDLPLLYGSNNNDNAAWISEWRRRPAQFLLQKWEQFLQRSQPKSTSQLASIRIVQLLQDMVRLLWGFSLRQVAHQRADLSYYMYILRKD